MRGKPREPYERTYVLLPQNADASWAEAVVQATWNDKRYTFGSSADDAGIGDLDVRKVVCVNPRAWDNNGDTIEAFFLEHYPGVEVEYVEAGSPVELCAKMGRRELLVGLHDEAGAYWMAANGVEGVCLIHHQVQDKAVALDYRYLQSKGITVIVRLNWGYADGTGTMCRPQDLDGHLAALAITMSGAYGVDYFHPWNEPNNASEWPGEYVLTPEYVVGAYNRLRHMVGPNVELGLPPLDPYYGPGSNNMDWLDYFLAHATGAAAWFLHGGKTQDGNPDSVWSDVKFTDPPLDWQYYHAKAFLPYLEKLRASEYGDRPVYCTELNPQTGWATTGPVWVEEMCSLLRQNAVTGGVFYRYEVAGGGQEIYSLANRPGFLSAIKGE